MLTWIIVIGGLLAYVLDARNVDARQERKNKREVEEARLIRHLTLVRKHHPRQ